MRLKKVIDILYGFVTFVPVKQLKNINYDTFHNLLTVLMECNPHYCGGDGVVQATKGHSIYLEIFIKQT